MAVLLKNASELSNIARDVGTVVLEGHLRYPSDAGGWQLGDLGEYLARRDVVDQVADWLKQRARPRASSAEG